MTKTCTACQIEKPLEDFYVDKRGKYGRYARCKPCFQRASDESRKRDMLANPEKWSARYKERAAALPKERKREYNRVWRTHHPEKVSEAIRRAHERNPEIYARMKRDWLVRMKRDHPDQLAAMHAVRDGRRRARVLGAAISDLTRAQWEEIKKQYAYRCAYCGKKPMKLTQDHVIPLARGGNHTASNIVPACKPCNSRKNVHAAPDFQPTLLL